jgi:uncharacterized membrane protein HdeD (DUF308 family)
MATTEGSPVSNQSNVSDSTASGKARHTGLRLAIGILSIVVGILVIARPVNTLVFVAVLFGLQLIILGVVRIVLGASTSGLPRWLKILSIILGILTIIAGVICFTRPQASLIILAILLAAGWIADGIADLARGFTGERSGGERTYLIILGVVSILAGLVVAIFPGPSLVLLAQIAGVALLFIGALTCLSAIMGRRRTA